MKGSLDEFLATPEPGGVQPYHCNYRFLRTAAYIQRGGCITADAFDQMFTGTALDWLGFTTQGTTLHPAMQQLIGERQRARAEQFMERGHE